MFILEIRVSQKLVKLGGAAGERRRRERRRPIKCQGWTGGENWSKLCSLGGRVSSFNTGSPFGWSKSEPSALSLKRIFWDFKGGW